MRKKLDHVGGSDSVLCSQHKEWLTSSSTQKFYGIIKAYLILKIVFKGSHSLFLGNSFPASPTNLPFSTSVFPTRVLFSDPTKFRFLSRMNCIQYRIWVSVVVPFLVFWARTFTSKPASIHSTRILFYYALCRN